MGIDRGQLCVLINDSYALPSYALEVVVEVRYPLFFKLASLSRPIKAVRVSTFLPYDGVNIPVPRHSNVMDADSDPQSVHMNMSVCSIS